MTLCADQHPERPELHCEIESGDHENHMAWDEGARDHEVWPNLAHIHTHPPLSAYMAEQELTGIASRAQPQTHAQRPSRAQARANREQAIERSGKGASKEWNLAAYRFLARYVHTHPELFTDDLNPELRALPGAGDMRSVGYLVQCLVKEGLIEDSGKTRDSIYHHSTNRPIWRSLVYGHDLPPRLSDPDADSTIVRQGARDTEVNAAWIALPRSGTRRRQVLDHITLAREKGATDEEMQDALGLHHNTQTPRRNELEHGGWIVDSGRRRLTRSGAEAIVWVLAPGAEPKLIDVG